MAQFLIVYDQREGRVLELTEYSDGERGAALERRFELERLHRKNEHIEVVVLGADTHDDLTFTHARYFKTVAQLADDA